MTDFPEAPVTMFTNYKRTDGFEVSLTMRGEDVKTVATALDTAIKGILAGGGTPVSRQKAGFPQKQVDYVQGRSCPKCGARLVRSDTKRGKVIKCENNKYDFNTKTASGCQFIEWPQPVNIPEKQIDDVDYGDY